MLLATLPMNVPSVPKASTYPRPLPRTSSSASASCLAYVTKIVSPIAWIPNGAKPAGMPGSTNVVAVLTTSNVLSNMSTLALWKSVAYNMLPSGVEAIARPL